jgi:hypothetical protein
MRMLRAAIEPATALENARRLSKPDTRAQRLRAAADVQTAQTALAGNGAERSLPMGAFDAALVAPPGCC